MKNGYRIITLLLIFVLVLSIFTLSSCNRKYNEEEVTEATKKLLTEAEMLNKVYYGSGIEYFEGEGNKGNYRVASSVHLEQLGFSTIEELKEITEKTFSDGYSEILYSTILAPLRDGEYYVSPARYYQEYDEKTNEPTHIMVNSSFSPLMKDSVTYDLSSISVEKSKKERVYVKVKATVTTSDGKSQSIELTVNLIEESDGWKIDNPTYANYNPYKDKYDELKDKDFN